LVASLHQIVAGETVVASDLSGVLESVDTSADAEVTERDRFSELTPRETEILCHLAAGQSNKVIARELGISDGTVKLHVKSILRKLEVHSRVQAAVIAVEAGICKHDD
ncbi:MAG: LuxR C-terminal-related transcriptional regulator, partial [Pseudomonadota bacterium]